MRPIFIIGMPRSGTKLLREILNNHPEVSIPRAESGFIPYFYRKFSKRSNLKANSHFKEFYDDFKKSSFYYYMSNSEVIWNEDHFYSRLTSGSLANAIETIYQLHADYEHKTIWGDKTPGYIKQTALIKKFFPDARFVHIVRDVRDYCLSSKNAWNKNIFRSAQKWSDSVETVRKQDDLDAYHYYEIRYEDLVDQPFDVIQKLCRWLNIEFYSDMLRFKTNFENLSDRISSPGIARKNYNKWMREFNSYQIRRIESIAGRTLLKLGYEVSIHGNFKPISFIENIIYLFSDIINLLIFRCKEYGKLSLALRRMYRDFIFKH